MHETQTVLQLFYFFEIACTQFCFNESLQIAGNCRICLINVLHITNPLTSCNLKISQNLIINTETPFI